MTGVGVGMVLVAGIALPGTLAFDAVPGQSDKTGRDRALDEADHRTKW